MMLSQRARAWQPPPARPHLFSARTARFLATPLKIFLGTEVG